MYTINISYLGLTCITLGQLKVFTTDRISVWVVFHFLLLSLIFALFETVFSNFLHRGRIAVGEIPHTNTL